MDKPEYLTVTEVAALLRVCTRTVRYWIAQDKLPARRISSRLWLIPRDAPLLRSLEQLQKESLVRPGRDF